MDTKNLTTFIYVAELRSFTKAADRLGFSQSTVSFQIKQMENELGCQLFERINHTVQLTEKGREVLEYAHQNERRNRLRIYPSGYGRLSVHFSSLQGFSPFPGTLSKHCPEDHCRRDRRNVPSDEPQRSGRHPDSGQPHLQHRIPNPTGGKSTHLFCGRSRY